MMLNIILKLMIIITVISMIIIIIMIVIIIAALPQRPRLAGPRLEVFEIIEIVKSCCEGHSVTSDRHLMVISEGHCY